MRDVIPFTGDATILANVIRIRMFNGGSREQVGKAAFKVATCRYFDETSAEDRAHLEAAWKIIDGR